MPEMFVGLAALMALVALSPKISPRAGSLSVVGAKRPFIRIFALTAALAIDVSKTSTLGFVLPGMQEEYGLSNVAASGLSVAGLSGTACGAIAARVAASRVEEHRIYLLSAIGFMLTSCCAMMPTFNGNLVMCFLMGVSVGGLAPIVVAAIRDISKGTRGGVLVFSSSVATAAGFLIAAGTSAWLEPIYSWRVLWLIGIPTGLVLIPLSMIIRSNRVIASADPVPEESFGSPKGGASVLTRSSVLRALLFCFSFVTGLTGFALTVWTPTLVRETGAPNAQLLLAIVAAVLLVASFGFAGLQVVFGTRVVLGVAAGGTGVSLLILAMASVFNVPGAVAAVALMLALFGSNAMAALVLPTAAQNSGPTGGAKFTAEVSVLNRLGGLLGPPLLAALVTSSSATYTAIAAAGGACCLLTVAAGSRTSAHDVADGADSGGRGRARRGTSSSRSG